MVVLWGRFSNGLSRMRAGSAVSRQRYQYTPRGAQQGQRTICFRQSEWFLEFNGGEAWISSIVTSFANCRVMCRHFVHVSHVSSRAFKNASDHTAGRVSRYSSCFVENYHRRRVLRTVLRAGSKYHWSDTLRGSQLLRL